MKTNSSQQSTCGKLIYIQHDIDTIGIDASTQKGEEKLKKTKTVLAALVLVGFGHITGVVLNDQRPPYSHAQGISAPQKQYRMCLSADAPKAHHYKYLNDGKLPIESRTVTVPPGWTPIGGMGPAHIIMCK